MDKAKAVPERIFGRYKAIQACKSHTSSKQNADLSFVAGVDADKTTSDTAMDGIRSALAMACTPEEHTTSHK